MDIEIIGFIAGGLSAALFIPQIIKTVKEKSAEQISVLTCVIGIVSSALWIFYAFHKDSVSMKICNSIAILASAVLLGLKYFYRNKSSSNN